MGRCCSVYGCKSNYRSEKEKVSTFSLPHPVKEKDLRAQWLRKIPTDLSKIKNPYVCIKHFNENCIVWQEEFVDNGELKVFQRSYPKLKPGTVPTIFPNLPERFSSNKQPCRRLCDAEEEQLKLAVAASLQDFQSYEEDIAINTLSDMAKYFLSKRHEFNLKWTVIEQSDMIVMCLVDVSDVPCVVASAKINCDFGVTVYVKKIKMPLEKLPKHLHRITTKNLFDELLKYVEDLVESETVYQGCLVNQAIEMLENYFVENDSLQLQFIMEQIQYLTVTDNNRRYNGSTLIVAASLYIHSPTAYNALLKSGYVFVPHPRTLQKLISRIDVNSLNLEGSIEYLKLKKKFLKDHECIVNILLDEIYIEQQLTFKGGSVYGTCKDYSDDLQVAKTAQVFMISSILSQYRDVVSIVPVNKLTAVHLKSMLVQVICKLEEMGFVVLSVISDNNAVNKKTFELMTPNKILQPSIPHPVNSERKLFFIFGTVHGLKSIRNNWISKNGKCLKYPNFDDFETIVPADFKFLELLYSKEKGSLVKYGHLLCNKALFPSNIQKQNVTLALRIFDERNVSALKCMVKKDADFANCGPTIDFMQIVCNWWRIVNVKSALEGKRFNDKFREPIRENVTYQVDFLKKMSHWLKVWKHSVHASECLSPQTVQSLTNTLDAFVELISYVFEKYGLRYVLLGKFQSDNLEGRFSSYRQLSGANYYISYIQLLEVEKKLRFKDTLSLYSTNKAVPLRTLLPCSGIINTSVNSSEYAEVLDFNFSFNDIPENIFPVLVYISGYAVMKELFLKKCDICMAWVQSNKEVDVCIGSDFLSEYDRGKLTVPTECAVISTAIPWFLLGKLLEICESSFLCDTNQLSVLYELSQKFGDDYAFSINVSEVCNCNRSAKDLLHSIMLRACKTFINNVIKLKNDDIASKKCQRQLKKFKIN